MTTAAQLLDQAHALFLDFDGPIAALMPPPVNAEAASKARAQLRGVEMPPEIATTTDHLAVLRYAMEHTDAVSRVEAACTAAELEAAGSCASSPHALDLFNYAERRSIPLAIVSNNAESAVRTFITRMGWEHQVGAYACRTPETTRWLKPSPCLLRQAANALHVDVSTAVFVGDSVSDVVAGSAAGTPVIGLAKNDQRREELVSSGAAVVVTAGNRTELVA